MVDPLRQRTTTGNWTMMVGLPTKGYKSSTVVLLTRKPRSKWWHVVCFGQKGHYRPDGSCAHTDEMVGRLNPKVVRPELVRVLDGREERKRP